MDTTTLRGQRLLPVPCFTNQSQQLNFKSFFGLRCSRPITRYSQLISSQPHSWRAKCPARRLSFQISAAADFSKRRQRKGSSSRSRGPDSSPKGFTSKPPVGTSMQKDKRNYGDGETSVTSTSGVHGRAHETGTDGIQEIEVSRRAEREEDSTVDAVNGQVGEMLKMSEKLSINMGNVNGSITVSHDDSDDSSSALESADHQESMTEFSDDRKTLTSLGSEQERHLKSGDDFKISAARDEEGRSLVDFVFSESTSVAASVDDGEVGLGCDQVNMVPSFDNVKIPVPWDKDRESLEGLEKDQVRPVSMDNEQKSLTTLQDNVRTLAELGGDQKSLVVSLRDQKSLLSVSDQQESLVALVSDPKISVASVCDKNSLVALGDIRKKLIASETSDLGAALVEMGLGEEVDAVEDIEEKSDSLSGFENSTGMDVYEFEDNLITEETLDETSSGAVLSEIPQELHEEQIEYDGIIMETNVVKQKSLEHYEHTTCEDSQAEDPSHTLQLEMEAHRRRQVLEELAEVNFSAHNKSFSYPELVKSGQEVEVFLNRSLSALKNEPDVLVTGAFNDWRWKSFTMSLEKTHLNGDWWSFKIHVPNEAYTIDFVFFNGKNVYENNDRKDFHVAVEGGLNAAEFEDFLLEEKRRELEMMAKERAEKERQAEEQRRIQEENAASEADRAQAKLEIERGKANLEEIMKKAKGSVDNLWYFEPQDFGGEDLVRLYYNRISGPLARAKDIWIHGGHNNWTTGLSITTKLVKSERKDGNWWFAEVIVPDGALMLNWVFADGPPQNASVYDNNHRQDFHAVVPKSIPNELHWVQEEQRIYRRLQRERQERQEALRAKVEITARMRAEAKERSLKRFLMSQKHIVYTDPLDVQAGKDVTVYYNPANTVLSGKPEIWFRCSFNRWTHRNGPLAPQKMVPHENGSHVRTVVKVPLDAYMMDFVFSEKEDGGMFDNKDGIDYHVPVFGGIMKEPPMHIVHIAVEMAPIAKVGGLGDVVTSLSRAVQDLNHHVDIILPKYNCMNLNHVKDLHYQRSYPWGGTEIKVWLGKVEGLSVYFLDPSNGFFSTGCIYGCRNDGERFGFFCHAALEFLKQTGSNPDILHCHDWSSAPISWLFKEHYIQCGLSKARVVFTIHNLEFGAQLIGKAMAYSDKATTVSHAYSKEVAGNPAIAPHLQKFHGILNGIDPDIWDPFNDKFIPVAYTSENVIEGKAAAKEALQRKIGFRVGDIPLVGVISRLTHQKGIHLIKHAIRRTLERGGQVILLGSAPDPCIQNEFVDLANQLHSAQNDIARLFLTYDEPFSHMIYAAADFILVPSIFEPCGLTQLVAMRYGAIPVVRKTGGLYDTVFDVDHDEDRARALDLKPNGFSFEGADTAGVDYALDRAISAWYDKREWFHSLCKLVMEQDWSWNRPALDYLELYHAARKY